MFRDSDTHATSILLESMFPPALILFLIEEVLVQLSLSHVTFFLLQKETQVLRGGQSNSLFF